MPEGYSIRFANQLDIPALIAADRAASELFRPTGLIPDMATIPESVPAEVLSAAIEMGMVLVAEDEHGPIGFVLCQPRGSVLYLDQISVDPAHGRKGLGRILMAHVYMLAEEHKLSAVVLSTFRDLPWNGPFYRRLGFREIARNKMEDWMIEIETVQAETLDVEQRCFMRRPVRRFSLRRAG
ncbi:MAG: GNAT family N-acetyltransferase [Pseudomonadota bacterium]